MLKLLYLHQYFRFPDQSGGTRSYDLAKRFVGAGMEVEIISSTSDRKYCDGGPWHLIEKDGLRVHVTYLPYSNSMSFFERKIVFLKFLFRSTRKLLAMKGDALIATSTPLTIGIPAILKKIAHRTPFVFEVRDVWPEAVIAIGAIKSSFVKSVLFALEKAIYQHASAIVALSLDMRRSILSRYPGIAAEKVSVIENISEIDRFQSGFGGSRSVLREKIGTSPRFTVLYAGTFGKVNGLSYVVELARRLIKKDAGIAFVLMGDGAELGAVVARAKEAGVLGRNLFVVDPVSKTALSQYYYEADMGSSFVIAVPELWANSANKFFDSLAASRPILINHFGWQRDVIEGNDVGFVFNPDLDQVTDDDLDAFVSYTRDRERQLEKKAAARRVAVSLYSLDIAASKYASVLAKLMPVSEKAPFKN